MKKSVKTLFSLSFGLLMISGHCVAENVATSEMIASVNGEAIAEAYYLGAIQRGISGKFYHGKIPDNELEQFKQGIVDKLIADKLLEQEAIRLGLTVNTAVINEKIASADQKNAENSYWQENREALHRIMREALTQAQLIDALRSATLKKIAPGDEEVQRYYRNNQDKFTTPEKLHVSTILLKVDPSSTAETWNAAREEALEILQQLRGGRDFSQLAMIKSGHESAENGGDMGYIHRGMLAEEAQKAIDQLKSGELSKPVRLLEGVAIFRVEERVPPKLNSLAEVRERAHALLKREKEDEAWAGLIEKLRLAATITTNQMVMDRPFVKSHTP